MNEIFYEWTIWVSWPQFHLTVITQINKSMVYFIPDKNSPDFSGKNFLFTVPEKMAQSIRTLTDEEKEKLAKDATLVSEFKRNKFEQEAQKNWDIFYKRNTTKFFKDRHWTRREFADLVNSSSQVFRALDKRKYLVIISDMFC